MAAVGYSYSLRLLCLQLVVREVQLQDDKDDDSDGDNTSIDCTFFTKSSAIMCRTPCPKCRYGYFIDGRHGRSHHIVIFCHMFCAFLTVEPRPRRNLRLLHPSFFIPQY